MIQIEIETRTAEAAVPTCTVVDDVNCELLITKC
jgi:hypothetical protein